MKKITKNLMLVIVMAALCFAVAVTANAETWEDFEYAVLEDGTVEITDYIGNDIEVIVPDEINGYIVASIGEKAFSRTEGVESIILPESITEIKNKAFDCCFDLKTFAIPNNLKLLGEDCFKDNISLEKFIVADENQYFSTDENGVLFNKDKTELICFPALLKMKEYTVPSTVKSIRSSGFHNCIYLINIILPDELETIGDYAFDWCYNLKTLTFPGSMDIVSMEKEIPMHAMKSITISDGVGAFDDLLIYFQCVPIELYVESMDTVFIERDYIDTSELKYVHSDKVDTYYNLLYSCFWEKGYTTSNWGEDIDFALDLLSCYSEDPVYSTIYCHSGSTAETYAVNKGLDYVLTHFFKGEWTYDYENMVRTRKCIHCDELETEQLEITDDSENTPTETPEETEEDFIHKLFVFIISLLEFFRSLFGI